MGINKYLAIYYHFSGKRKTTPNQIRYWRIKSMVAKSKSSKWSPIWMGYNYHRLETGKEIFYIVSYKEYSVWNEHIVSFAEVGYIWRKHFQIKGLIDAEIWFRNMLLLMRETFQLPNYFLWNASSTKWNWNPQLDLMLLKIIALRGWRCLLLDGISGQVSFLC